MTWLGTSRLWSAKLKEFIWYFKAFFHGVHELLRFPSLSLYHTQWEQMFTHFGLLLGTITTLHKSFYKEWCCGLILPLLAHWHALSDQRMSLPHSGTNIFSSLLHQGEQSGLKIHLESRRCMHIAVFVRSFKEFVTSVGNIMTFSRCCTPVGISSISLVSLNQLSEQINISQYPRANRNRTETEALKIKVQNIDKFGYCGLKVFCLTINTEIKDANYF